jgi:phytoene desaturase
MLEDTVARRSTPGGRARVLIVGSGFGGLAAAIRLQAAGYACALYEARDKPGGRAYVYEQDGFRFDGGPTVITAPECLEQLFEVAGRRLRDYIELLPVTPFYRLLWPDGDRFDYSGDGPALLAQIRTRNPADVNGYERFLDYSRRVFHKGYEQLAATPFSRVSDMLRVAPALLRLRADRSVYATVARFIEDERLRQAFSFHSLLVGGNPFETSAIYTLIHYLERNWGVFFPRGGTGALVAALVRLFEELGGELHLSSPIERIRIVAAPQSQGALSQGAAAPGGAALGSVHRATCLGQERDFDLVVSNADLHHTYDQLYRGTPGAQRMVRRLERLDWSMSLFVLYFGANRRYDEVAHHTVLFGARYRELLRDIFEGPELPEDFSLYLHAPCVTDPSMAPEGCSAFYVLSPVPHLGKAQLDWDSVGPRYAARILEALEQRVLPDLRRHLITQHFITPRSFERDLAAFQGSAFSVAPKLTQSAWFRPHNRDARIPGLYLVGAGTHPGAGLPGVINSAQATVGLILGQRAAPAPRPESALAAEVFP